MMGLFWPPREIAIGLLGRALVIWAGARMLFWFAHLPPDGGLGAAVIVVVVVAVVAEVESRRRNLHRLLPNLAVPTWRVRVIHLIPPIVGELLLLQVVRR